jgi:serine phosphatase RsbU (regulator of sigma subunit)/predicted negative regulator of RcsB-dependent stress response
MINLYFIHKTILVKAIHHKAKKIRYITFSFVLFTCAIYSTNAQNKNTLDSLNQVYKKTALDSIRSLILYEIAREYRHAFPDTAFLVANKGLAIAQKANFQRGIAINLNILGIIELNKGDYLKALTYLFDGLKINEKIQNKKDISFNLNNIGEVYRLQNNYNEALKYYTKALLINEKIAFKQGVAINLNNIGEVYKEQGKYIEALVYFFKSLKICEKINDKARIALRLNNIGEIYAKQNKYTEALNAYLKAFKISEESNNKLYMTIELDNIANIYLKTNDLKKSLEYANKSLEIAKEINAKKEINTSLKTITSIYTELADYANAFKYYQLFINYRDSLTNEEANKKIKEMQFNYEMNQKQKEIALLEKEKELQEQDAYNQTIYSVSFGIGALLLFILAAVLYQQNKYKLQANNLLQNKNIEINNQNEELNITLELVEKQKQEMLAQNEELYQQQEEILAVNETLETTLVKFEVTASRLNKSIQYANQIQQVILPKKDKLDSFFQSHFSIYLPKDIVSGDFYWFIRLDEYKAIFILADCTGHGVPGAFMSMIGNTLLHEIIKSKSLFNPAEILADLHTGIKNVLKQEESQNADGMDISICLFEKDESKIKYQVTFAGAKSNLFYTQDNQIYQLIGDRIAIGGLTKRKVIFTNQKLILEENDLLYFTSDGYIDQHNAERKRFGSSKFKKLLGSICQLSILKQQQVILDALKKHQKNEEQRDDISVVGIKL